MIRRLLAPGGAPARPNQAGDRPALRSFLLPPARDPRPLLFGPGRLGIIWSAKSACTTVLLWHLWHCDLLEQALAHHRWPHRFRSQMLHKCKTYRGWARQAESSGWRWLRVLRDPYKRAVSSYRHALRHTYENRHITRVLRIKPENGYSFERFLDYLQQTDIVTCNIHHRAQFHPLEGLVTPTDVINVDQQNLMAFLSAIDATLAPPKAPTSALFDAIAAITQGHHASELASDDDHAATRFTREDALSGWPPYRCFLNGSTRRKIERIYAIDFDHYAAYF